MGPVPELLAQRWASGLLVGDAAHACLVRVRQGYMTHLYQDAVMLDTSPDQNVSFPTIWKGQNAQPWQGQWLPTGDWITLQNVESANWIRSFTCNGGSTLTVVIDNVAFNDQTGEGGLYHSIDRGWFSPTRGVTVASRPALWAENAWGDVLNGGYQIELWEGYGVGSDVVPVLDEDTNQWSAPAASKTWTGLIEVCDSESDPDHITLTCRDFSVMVTDQRLMGEYKAKEISSPVTFADRRQTLGETKEFGSILVSSGQVTADSQLGAQWLSDGHADASHTEWVELHLPAGFYTDFYVALPFTGETMYISLNAAGGACLMDGTPVADGWVDLSLGSVPVSGEPYIAVHPNTWSDPSRRWSLGGHSFQLGDNSVLRLSFNPLAVDPDDGTYKAGTNSFYAFRWGTDPNASPGAGVNATGWVLVDDAADVIRMILLWAGFSEFDVQDFGWTLQAPMTFAQDSFFQDVIAAILAQGNYTFFLDPPTDHDLSIGVPVFRPQSAMNPAVEGMLTITDGQLLEAIEVIEDYSNVPYVMRYRGAVSSSGTTLFADLTKRFTGTYWPPWSGHDYTNLQGSGFSGAYPLGRTGGVRRQFSQTDPGLASVAECLFACILAAIQYALQAVTGIMQAPGLPGVGLDQQVSFVDQSTGTSSRMWLASVESDHTLGPDGTWHMVLGGSMLDTEDMGLIAQDYAYTYQRYVIQKGAT
jgi:hypothetical protein